MATDRKMLSFELLGRLFTDPSGLDGSGEHPVPMAIRKPDTADGEATGQPTLGAL